MHCVFSTKHRERWLSSEIRERLWPYLAGIARENGMKVMAIGGIEDHVHLLVSLPSTLSVATALQRLKGNSSKWLHETFPEMRAFNWQGGYGAFSIGVSGIEATTRYIQQQEKRHQRLSFQDELKVMLHRHGIEFEEWMLNDDAKIGA